MTPRLGGILALAALAAACSAPAGRSAVQASGSGPVEFTIVGRVVEEGTDRPVSGAVLEQVLPAEGLPKVRVGPPSGPTTGEEGRFAVAGLEPGTVRLRAWHEGLVESISGPIEGSAGEIVEGVVLRLGRGGGVDGYALDADGAPLSGGWVGAFPARIQSGRTKRSAIEGRTGRFLIEGVAPGRYRVQAFPLPVSGESAESSRRRIRAALADVREGEITRVEFPDEPDGGCLVTGRVVRGGRGVEGARVFALPAAVLAGDPDRIPLAGDRLQGLTGEDGTFAIERVPAGPAVLHAFPGGNGSSVSLDVEVPEGATLDVEVRLPAGEVRGRVVRASDGVPLAEVPVSAFFRESAEGKAVRQEPGHVLTDAEGRYRLADLTPGRYLLRAGRNNWGGAAEGASAAHEVREPVQVSGVAPTIEDFALVEGGIARVVVRDPLGEPVRDVWVEVHPAGEEHSFGRSAGMTDAEGTARLRGLPPGPCVVRVRSAPFAEPREGATGHVAAGEETVFPIRLVEGTRVLVRVRGADGSPLGRPFVEFTDGTGRATSVERGSSGIGSPEERAEGWGAVLLLPGDYTLRVRALGHRPRDLEVRIGEASPQPIEVSLEPQAGPRR